MYRIAQWANEVLDFSSTYFLTLLSTTMNIIHLMNGLLWASRHRPLI